MATRAYSIASFCREHEISRQTFYKLKNQGLAPRTYRCGRKVLISVDAAANWQRQMEALYNRQEAPA